MGRNRSSLGFPDPRIVDFWLNSEEEAMWPPVETVKMNGLKNTEVLVLKDYTGNASEDFWKNFPKRELPNNASTRVNVGKFRQLVEDVKNDMSAAEIRRAEITLHDLAVGASAYQKGDLPPLCSKNSTSATDNGAMLTDTIAT